MKVVQEGLLRPRPAKGWRKRLARDYDTARGILDGLGFTRASKIFAYPPAPARKV